MIDDENKTAINCEYKPKITKSGRQVKLPEKLSEYELYEVYCLLSEDPQNFTEAINKEKNGMKQ